MQNHENEEELSTPVMNVSYQGSGWIVKQYFRNRLMRFRKIVGNSQQNSTNRTDKQRRTGYPSGSIKLEEFYKLLQVHSFISKNL